ncbi:hypothetical protein BDP81DRAFT_453406 [Colletotrichum phormii]|uniref:Uncharacterized protein n=1 Tax=Colletotrichum phormii TaxID=359342 RepID=A0AAI9ZHG4_9PEZI|nr:uncharacterized protein BDP81DRAFT_453406 [Colletotrichum phormii]KAK1624664.1 hypothetical protein BDP81DRAFT_453406 [Colletotrichum phormii]
MYNYHVATLSLLEDPSKALFELLLTPIVMPRLVTFPPEPSQPEAYTSHAPVQLSQRHHFGIRRQMRRSVRVAQQVRRRGNAVEPVRRQASRVHVQQPTIPATATDQGRRQCPDVEQDDASQDPYHDIRDGWVLYQPTAVIVLYGCICNRGRPRSTFGADGFAVHDIGELRCAAGISEYCTRFIGEAGGWRHERPRGHIKRGFQGPHGRHIWSWWLFRVDG